MKLKKPKGLPKLGSAKKLLVIDPSSSHLGYVLVDLDNGVAAIESAGMIFTSGTWTKGQRFLYMDQCLKELLQGRSGSIPEVAVTEQFFMNPKLVSGVAVVPVVNGLIEKNCAEQGLVPYFEVPPPTWRAKLGVKADYVMENVKGVLKKKRDYKTPTIRIVENHLGKLPATIKSNITLKERDTPHDLADALAIALATVMDNGYNKFEVLNACFFNFTLIDRFNKKAKEMGNEISEETF